MRQKGRGSRNELLAEGADREETADAGGALGLVGKGDVGQGDVVVGLEGADELFQPAELGGGGAGLVEVADQADADAVWIDAGVAGWGGGGELFVPALADLQFAIDGTVAVADHEVITQRAAGFGKGISIAGGGAAVVDVDVFPGRLLGLGLGLEDDVHRIRSVDRKEAVGGIRGQRGGGKRHQ